MVNQVKFLRALFNAETTVERNGSVALESADAEGDAGDSEGHGEVVQGREGNGRDGDDSAT